MIFSLTFKTPDVLDQLTGNKEAQDVADNFVEYGEYIYIDFDTDKDTATVRRLYDLYRSRK